MPPRSLTSTDISGISKSFDALNEAIDALQDAVQRNAIDHATIKAKLEDVLLQLKTVSKTVSGDQGLAARVLVLESRLRTAEEDIEQKNKEIRDELTREVSALKSSIQEIQKAQQDKTKQELVDVKSGLHTSASRSISVWGAVISTLALLTTITLFSVQNCQHKGSQPEPPAPLAPASTKK